MSGELKIFLAYLSYVIQLNLKYWFKECLFEELVLPQGRSFFLIFFFFFVTHPDLNQTCPDYQCE